MAGKTVLILGAMLLAGCATEETRTVRESSISRQFAQLNKNGWHVASTEEAQKKASEPERDVRIIRDADFSGLTFRTNFQIDDPRLKEQQQKDKKAAEDAANSAPANPFGPWIPGR